MYAPGLKGITALETRISKIDGDKGELHYRGIPIGDVIQKRSFEEVVFLLLEGSFPNKEQFEWLTRKMKDWRALTKEEMDWIEHLSEKQSHIAVIRSIISFMDDSEDLWPISNEDAIHLIAKLPAIIAYSYRRRNGLQPVEPDGKLDHAENFLYMLFGEKKSKQEAAALEAYMILTAEHGLNASTFAGRVVTSTQSDLYSAITAAIGALKGPLHGGAPSGVLSYVDEVSQDSVENIIKRKITRNEKVMGFGHRVYKGKDPRAEALKVKLTEMNSKPDWVNQMMNVEQETVYWLKELKPDRELFANVEFYAAAIMKSIQIPAELFTPIFCSSRIAGWTAHMIEQSNRNVIFRPRASYVK